MLPVVAFILFWVVLGLAVFFIAVRGVARAPATPPQGFARDAARSWGLAFVVIYIGFGVAMPLAFLHGNNANANSQVGGITLTAGEKNGRILFGEHCGVCHTLAAANAVGKVGPNLDTLRRPRRSCCTRSTTGAFRSRPDRAARSCLGQGNMPAGIVQGNEAEQVSQFVGEGRGQGVGHPARRRPATDASWRHDPPGFGNNP